MSNANKIIFLHSHFLYWMGGTKYIFEIMRRVSKTNEVLVIVENASKFAIEQYKKENIRLVSLNKITSNNFIYWLTLPWQIITVSRKIKKYINNHDVLVVGMFPMNAVAAVLQVKYYQLCFEPFAFFHDHEFTRGFSVIKRAGLSILRYLYIKIDIRNTKKSKKIITLNKVTQRSILKVYGRGSVPIFSGIDTSHFKPYVGKKVASKYKDYDIIIHSTDYTPVKGTKEMIEIFSRISNEFPKAQLLITSTISNPKEEAKLLKLVDKLGITNKVKFLGFVDYYMLPQLYSIAKVLVQCSYSENSGTTSMALPVKEALACGTLCIRSPITDEDVVDNKTGYLVDPRNIVEMIKAIRKSLTMPKHRRNKVGKMARDRIIREYSWEATTDRFISIITNKK